MLPSRYAPAQWSFESAIWKISNTQAAKCLIAERPKQTQVSEQLTILYAIVRYSLGPNKILCIYFVKESDAYLERVRYH